MKKKESWSPLDPLSIGARRVFFAKIDKYPRQSYNLYISAKKNCAAAIENGFERWRLVLYDAIGRNISKN